jgi:hypothetical protein
MVDKPSNDGVGPVIDPTKNVLDLVEAAIKRIDDLFAAGVKRLDERIDAMVGRLGAESDKSNALRAQREYYEGRIDVVRSDFQKQIAANLERQTDKSAAVLSDAVNKANERLAAVEKNQYTVAGQAIVRDPATAEALANISAALGALSVKGNLSEGRSQGLSTAGALILGFCSVLAVAIVVAGFIIARVN